MTPPLPFPRVVFLSACGMALAACGSDPGRRNDEAVRKPAMPTVAPAVDSAPRRTSSEEELFAASLRDARANDIPAALRSLHQADDPLVRRRVVNRLATTLAEDDPARAAALAVALPPGTAQHDAVAIAGRALSRSNPDAALRWAVGLADHGVAVTGRREVMNELMRASPRPTLERLLDLPTGPAKNETLGIAAAAWAQHDPSAAVSWVRNQPEEELRHRLISSVGFEIAQTNPADAIALAELLPEGRNRWLLFGAIAQTWVAVDPKAALAWAHQLPTGAARDAALAGADTGFGVPASRRTARLRGLRGAGSRTRGGTAAAAAGDVRSAEFAAWLETQPPGKSRDDAILEYVRQRGLGDPRTVGQWIASLPGGATRDRAMEIFLDGLIRTSPNEAANWLRTLPHSDQSQQRIERTAREWLLRNRPAAEAWLRDAPLPEYRKEELLRQAGP